MLLQNVDLFQNIHNYLKIVSFKSDGATKKPGEGRSRRAFCDILSQQKTAPCGAASDDRLGTRSFQRLIHTAKMVIDARAYCGKPNVLGRLEGIWVGARTSCREDGERPLRRDRSEIDVLILNLNRPFGSKFVLNAAANGAEPIDIGRRGEGSGHSSEGNVRV